jgi:hypothetical protein
MSSIPPQGSNGCRGLLGADLVASQALEDDLAWIPGRPSLSGWLVGLVVVAARSEAKGPNESLDPGPDGRIRDAELPLHVAEIAARAEEALEQGELLAG